MNIYTFFPLKATNIIFLLFLVMGISCNKGNPIDIETGETLTDASGNVYHTIQIGNQVWMAENMRTTKYNDSTPIPLVTSSTSWSNLTSPAYCYYDNSVDVKQQRKYGALYNWYVVDSKKLAPAGWHVPTFAEWDTLVTFMILNGYNWDGTTDTALCNKIAKSLSARTDWVTGTPTTAGWICSDLSKNNKSGFSALPGGRRYPKSFSGVFSWFAYRGTWWCSTESDSLHAYGSGLYTFSDSLTFYNDIEKGFGLSVRLIKDK